MKLKRMKYVYMNSRDKISLEYILEHYQEITKLIYKLSFEDFCNNKPIQKTILFDVAQIGENINKLNEEIRTKINKIDIKGVVEFRNRLVHGYGDIDYRIVWNAIEGSLPNLIKQIKDILTSEKSIIEI